MTQLSWMIRGGHVVDPATGVGAIRDVAIADGLIEAIGDQLPVLGHRVFDATGLIVAPGLIDAHVHLRVPGQEQKETIATATAAAAAGGFTAVCCMPNTSPALDSVEVLADLASIVARDGLVPVYPIAAITKGRLGNEVVDFEALIRAGAIGFSDDGDTTADSALMRTALTASSRHGRPVMVHCEDNALAYGEMHEGDVSARLGLEGIPAAAEEIIIARDIALARLTGGWLHVLHVSTIEGADLIRRAKAAGAPVTAEVMPHHLTMDHGWVEGKQTLRHTDYPTRQWDGPLPDANAKVNPPLRTAGDTTGLLKALHDGVFDIIATDHAPHSITEKAAGFAAAPMGMSGLELALPLLLGMVRADNLTLHELVRRLSTEPARLFNLPGGTLAPGSRADLVVIDPEARWTISPRTLKTKSPNTALLGMELTGRAVLTLVAGISRHET